jgi:hypothetical protein
MGAAAPTVLGVPVEVAIDPDGIAVIGKVTCRILAGDSPIEVSASEVCVTDALGGGGHRFASGVSLPGMRDATARVTVAAHDQAEVSVWFDPIALGSTARFAVIAVLSLNGDRKSVASEARVSPRRPAPGTGNYPG